MIKGSEFVKLFSEAEGQEVEEKLFSTGNEELDELLEKVYSEGVNDGYDYAQKEFAEVVEQREFSKSDLRTKLFFNYEEYAKKHGEEAAKDLKKVRDLYAELAKDSRYYVGESEGAQYYVDKGKRLSGNSKKALKDMKEAANNIKAAGMFKKNMLKDNMNETAIDIKVAKMLKKDRPFVEKLKDKARSIKKWSKRNPGKAAVIATGVLAADAGLAYGAKKLVDKKKNKKD